MTDKIKIKLLSCANKTTYTPKVYCNTKLKRTNISCVTRPCQKNFDNSTLLTPNLNLCFSSCHLNFTRNLKLIFSLLRFLPNLASHLDCFSGFLTLALCLSFIVTFICDSFSPHSLLFYFMTQPSIQCY
jgi:hypothetical protein